MTQTSASTGPTLVSELLKSSESLVAALLGYANTGSAIGNGQRLSDLIAVSVKGLSPVQAVDCMKACIHGAINQLTRGFPGDAKDWARLSVDFADLIKDRDATAKMLLGDLESAINRAGLVAIKFHRATGSKASDALETGHLLSLSQQKLQGNPLDTTR